MKRNCIILLLTAMIFLVVGFLILYDQYVYFGVWFQFSDLHYETFALSSFALALGIVIDSVIKK